MVSGNTLLHQTAVVSQTEMGPRRVESWSRSHTEGMKHLQPASLREVECNIYEEPNF